MKLRPPLVVRPCISSTSEAEFVPAWRVRSVASSPSPTRLDGYHHRRGGVLSGHEIPGVRRGGDVHDDHPKGAQQEPQEEARARRTPLASPHGGPPDPLTSPLLRGPRLGTSFGLQPMTYAESLRAQCRHFAAYKTDEGYCLDSVASNPAEVSALSHAVSGGSTPLDRGIVSLLALKLRQGPLPPADFERRLTVLEDAWNRLDSAQPATIDESRRTALVDYANQLSLANSGARPTSVDAVVTRDPYMSR